MKSLRITLISGITLAACVLGTGPAWGAGTVDDPAPAEGGGPTTRAGDFAGPLSLEVDLNQLAWVTQNFAGKLDRVDKDGTVTEIVNAPGEEISAVATRDEAVYFVRAAFDHTASSLMRWVEGEEPERLADLFAHEAAENPDQANTYGFVDLPEECRAQFTAQSSTPAEYTGVVDTHAYATLALHNALFIADAGANAITKVGYDGSISTVAVLPPQPAVEVSAEIAAQAGFPACVAGAHYAFEPVPTDVEIGPNGDLYVTTLPGGPEDASLGARGSVYRIDPHTGETEQVATGFIGATGLGVSTKTGAIVVAELFGGPDGTGQVSVVHPGASTPELLLALPSPSAIELRTSNLFVTTDSFVPDAQGAPQPIGKLTVVPLDHRSDTIELEEQ